MTWSEYKKFVKESSPDFQKLSGFILATGLISQLGELSHIHQKEYIQSNNGSAKELNMSISRVMRVGDLFWYLASLENLFSLPDTVYAEQIKYVTHEEVSVNDIKEQDKAKPILFLDEFLVACSNTYKSCYTGNLSELQYDVNETFSLLLDYCYFYKLDVSQVLEVNKAKLQKQLEGSGKQSYSDEYQNAKKIIKEAGQKELLIDLKVVKGKYCGLQLVHNRKKNNYNTGDIIKDFYQCTLFMFALNDKDESYTVNYSSKFREFMDLAKDYSVSYLCDGELKSLTEMKSGTALKNNFLKLDKRHKPVLINSKIKKFDDLLDYINSK